MSITPTPAAWCPNCRCELVFAIRALADACPRCKQLWEWNERKMAWENIGELGGRVTWPEPLWFEDEQSCVPYESRYLRRSAPPLLADREPYLNWLLLKALAAAHG